LACCYIVYFIAFHASCFARDLFFSVLGMLYYIASKSISWPINAAGWRQTIVLFTGQWAPVINYHQLPLFTLYPLLFAHTDTRNIVIYNIEKKHQVTLVACVSFTRFVFYHSLTTFRERIIRIPRDASGFTGNLRRPLRAHVSFVLFFPIFSRFFPEAAAQAPGLSSSPSMANRDSIVFLSSPRAAPSLGRWRRIGIVKTGYPYRDNTLLFVVVPRSGKAHFRARYKLHTPLIAAARNLRNNAVITWFSAVVAARAILLPGQTREFITSFLFP